MKIGGYFDYSDIATEGIFDRFKKNKPDKYAEIEEANSDNLKELSSAISFTSKSIQDASSRISKQIGVPNSVCHVTTHGWDSDKSGNTFVRGNGYHFYAIEIKIPIKDFGIDAYGKDEEDFSKFEESRHSIGDIDCTKNLDSKFSKFVRYCASFDSYRKQLNTLLQKKYPRAEIIEDSEDDINLMYRASMIWKLDNPN